MKRFLKESGGVSEYPDVTIEWIRHHNPDLAIYQNGVKIQTMSIEKTSLPSFCYKTGIQT